MVGSCVAPPPHKTCCSWGPRWSHTVLSEVHMYQDPGPVLYFFIRLLFIFTWPDKWLRAKETSSSLYILLVITTTINITIMSQEVCPFRYSMLLWPRSPLCHYENMHIRLPMAQLKEIADVTSRNWHTCLVGWAQAAFEALEWCCALSDFKNGVGQSVWHVTDSSPSCPPQPWEPTGLSHNNSKAKRFRLYLMSELKVKSMVQNNNHLKCP